MMKISIHQFFFLINILYIALYNTLQIKCFFSFFNSSKTYTAMSKLPLLTGVLATVLTLSSCVKDQCTRVMTYTKYEPIYVTYDEVRQPINVEGARSLTNPGKIYMYDNYIYINEQMEGVHIIDNTNPSDPKNIGFIAIPGNMDIAVRNNILYADCYMDLVALNITAPNQVQLMNRVENVFPTLGEDPNKGILMGYDAKEVTEEVNCDDVWALQQGPWMIDDINTFNVANTTTTGNLGAGATGSAGRESGSGLGGSMARFTLFRDYLYTVDNEQLHVFDISTPSNPNKVNTVSLGWGIETIMPYQDKLFVGTNTGVLIYDNQNPSSPSYMSRFDHANSCDPVYIDNDFAYVTLRSGTRCQGFNNQLDILDVSNLNNPTLVSTYAMHNPHGLSVKNNILYLCDGDEGLKVFDVTDKMTVDQHQLFHDNSMPTYDVIASPSRDLLFVIGDKGFYQYDRSNPSGLTQLSHIPVED